MSRKMHIFPVALAVGVLIFYVFESTHDFKEKNIIAQKIMELGDEGFFHIRDVVDLKDVRKICLGSRVELGENSKELDGCAAHGNVFVLSKTNSKTCTVLQLDELEHRILTGSDGETECVNPSPDAIIELINSHNQIYVNIR